MRFDVMIEPTAVKETVCFRKQTVFAILLPM